MEIVELPPLKRKVEWPTVALAIVIYGLWFAATFFWRDLHSALPALGAWIIAWQMNLQHETIHGHPTQSRLVNEAIGVWPLALWLPYATFRTTHLRHHQDANLTDPFEDPESYYWTEAGWRDLGPTGRKLVRFQSTLLGRMLFGPAWMMSRSIRDELRDGWAGKPAARATLFWHLIQCAPVMIWVMGVCGMPLWLYVAAFVYPGMSLAMVRSFAEHRAAPEAERRTAIVEDARLLGPLFLFNNLHVAHHVRGRIPWYLLPKFYRLNRAALIARNGGLVYRSYLDVARRYLLSPHDAPVHPGWIRKLT
ncbi:MAG TPA: fatty acid desaturase [Roseiarcus sp.]|nr:fatty acid desaturase [Roseiarcus sp.]